MVRSPLDEAVITHRLRELRQGRYFRGGDSGNAMTAETSPASESYGALAPRMLDRAVIAMTAHMPANWLGRLLANGLRRIVMQRLPEDGGVDVKRWGLRLRLHPRRNGGVVDGDDGGQIRIDGIADFCLFNNARAHAV